MAKRKPTPWVVLEGEGLFCRRCGAREKLFPATLTSKRIAAMKLIGAAFEDEHRKCEVTEQSPVAQAGRSTLHWLASGDAGVSSITICVALGALLQRECPSWWREPSWPRDPADFGRCHRLLVLFPELRARLGEVAKAYPNTPWVPYVREWDRMTALYEEELPRGEAPKLYALMQALLAEVQP